MSEPLDIIANYLFTLPNGMEYAVQYTVDGGNDKWYTPVRGKVIDGKYYSLPQVMDLEEAKISMAQTQVSTDIRIIKICRYLTPTGELVPHSIIRYVKK